MKFNKETNSIIKGSEKVGCLTCGEPTEYIEVCSESHFCSTECVDKFYEEYSKHLESMCECHEV
ncbi:MAG: hypothetical protein KHZ90_08385 [Veillonella parvula]|uniref:Uncharacterized protein n=1 Tax=Veillonella parvula TaxID=29466 RepID=A0A942WS27_VEIPA|nr:hypothetical protein [Veillonella parvula]MBS4893778.1 hypothetical protein [Veillonella parvula]